MADIQDQIAQAKAAGYSDAAIASKIASIPGYADKIELAAKAGYTPSDIIAHLAGPVTNAPAAPTTGADAIPLPSGAAARIRQEALAAPSEKPESFLDKAKGIGEAGLNLITGATGGVLGMAGGLIGGLAGAARDHNVTPEQQRQNIGDAVDAGAAQLTYQPRTQAGQRYAAQAAQALEDSGIAGIPIPELEGAGRAAASSAAGIRALARSSAAAATAEDIAALSGARRAAPITGYAAPVGDGLDIPAYLRRAQESVPASAVSEQASGIDLARYINDKSFMDSLSPADQSSLRQNYIDANHWGSPDALRQNARQNGAEIIGRNIAPSGDVVSDTPIASVIDDAATTNRPIRSIADVDALLQDQGGASPVTASAPAEVAQAVDAVPFDQAQRLQVLRDVGLENVRQSALDANPAQAAQEYQVSKFTNEPAGLAALDQFNHEREALTNHVQGIIDRTGAPSGLDEQSLYAKGQAIAAPFDAARAYFESAKGQLYKLADERAAASGAPVETAAVDSLLSDPDFKATLMAQDKAPLLNTIRSQFQRFKDLDPSGALTVPNAELYRKWLNAVWSPDNSKTLGIVKGALDNDVFKSAGEDVYQAARQTHKLEKATLDDPQGISRLMDADPFTPINRTTAFNKIPDAITNLSPDQFRHIIDTYRALPPQLQPMAQQAINTIKAHYGDKLLQAGSETGYGNQRQLWNGGGIKKIIENNAAKIPMIFTEPGERAAIRNLVHASDILHVPSSYPGAAAQAAGAFKQGLMSKSLGKVGTALGGGAGAFLGPAGAGAGAFIGDTIGNKLLKDVGERRALEQFKRGIISTIEQQAPTSTRSNLAARVALARQQKLDRLTQAQTVDQAIQAVANP